VALIFLAEILLALPLAAQRAHWVTDSRHSIARLFAASSDHKDLVNVAVTRVSGELKQDEGNALPVSFNFDIYPADQSPAAVQSGASGSPGSAPWWEATLLRFRSTSIEPVDKNTIRVRGEMTATYISRETIWAGPSSRDYSGPKYGPPQTHTGTHEVTFEFRKNGHNETAVTSLWSGSTVVPSTDFPTLWNAMVATTWPVFKVGEKIVETTPPTNMRCSMPPVTTGEDFTGEVCNGYAPQILSDPDSAGVPGAHRKDVANQVEMKLEVYLVKM